MCFSIEALLKNLINSDMIGIVSGASVLFKYKDVKSLIHIINLIRFLHSRESLLHQ